MVHAVSIFNNGGDDDHYRKTKKDIIRRSVLRATGLFCILQSIDQGFGNPFCMVSAKYLYKVPSKYAKYILSPPCRVGKFLRAWPENYRRVL